MIPITSTNPDLTYTTTIKPVNVIPIRKELERPSKSRVQQDIIQTLEYWQKEIDFSLEEFETLAQLLEWSGAPSHEKNILDSTTEVVNSLRSLKNRMADFGERWAVVSWKKKKEKIKENFSILQKEIEFLNESMKKQKKIILKQLILNYPMTIR